MDSQYKHTEGEWFISGGMVDGYELRSTNGEIIIPNHFNNGLHHRGNANLLQAAPEMLQMLESTKVYLSIQPNLNELGKNLLNMINTTIEKAKYGN